MTPVEIWEAQRESVHYRPEAFDAEGFIHCTDNIDELVAVGNRYYQEDPRNWIAVEIDCDGVAASKVYEDALRKFPHIYGPLETAAIRRVANLERSEDGTFTGLALDTSA